MMSLELNIALQDWIGLKQLDQVISGVVITVSWCSLFYSNYLWRLE